MRMAPAVKLESAEPQGGSVRDLQEVSNGHGPLAPKTVGDGAEDERAKDGAKRRAGSNDLHLGVRELMSEVGADHWQGCTNDTSVITVRQFCVLRH